jgi:putative ATP-dependent endonuclease of OLD family
MKLERVVIKNFRSIEHVEFTFPKSGFLVLVGANNAGKSNIIRAIDAMCGDQWFSRDKVENHDHYLRDRSRPIEIKLGFSDRSYAEWRSDGDRRYPTLYDSSGRSLFGGPQPKDAFPCIYLGADRTFDRHMAFWDWTLIGKIRKQFNLKAKPVERELREKFDEVVKVFDKIHGFPQFKKDFARFFQEMQADTDAKLNIDFKPYTPSNYFKTMQIVAQDADIGDEKFDLEERKRSANRVVTRERAGA